MTAGPAAASAGALADHRPALREGVLVSDAFLHGPRTVHLIKDTAGGQSFQVGVKESFLISRMDGSRTLAQLGEAYASEYGRRLGDANWLQLLGMLGTRGLLAGPRTPPPGPVPEAPAAGPGAVRAAKPAVSGAVPEAKPAGPGAVPEAKPAHPAAKPARRLMSGSLRLVADADATAARLHRAVGFLLRPVCLVPLLGAVLAMQTVLALRAGEALLAARDLFLNPVLLTATAVLLWLSTALHELAHGVVARHFGGRVGEIGLRWRLPVVIMYCTVDNYLYLRTRWHRIATAVAGAVMNLLFLLPFCALWLWAPLDTATHDALTGLLLLGSAQAYAMLVPLPPLDGYKIVSQWAGATELAASSRDFLRLALRRDPAAAGYPRRARTVYTVYGLGSLLVLGVLAASAAALIHHLLTAARAA
ncbi:M50 family metallopeptidase [Streptomyces sp. Je 1-79]|uniref:metalloprotease n=1 Tax=Streptomyces sp. Je 1-79 TaxID=2943847 RepID=UPI0021A37E42|nr:M50 family metallopeptidase [Streptomyces sp. Je 1-79]MCT4353373.1 M50 family metallopeptidase [Streptomyces sp. Je 1-79]